jgi:serine/threonine protein kinase
MTKKHIIANGGVVDVKTERAVLQRIRHPFIVRLYYAFQSAAKLYLVMDFVNGGQIFFHLRQARPSPRRRRPEAGGRPARAGAVEL